MSLPDTYRDMKVKSDYEKLIKIIEDEPIFTQSVFKQLGVIQGLKHTIWMVFHPYTSAKIAAAGFRNSILRKLYIRSCLNG